MFEKRSINIDKYLDRAYHFQDYNCGHFVAEVYQDLTGNDIDYICNAFYEKSSLEFTTMIRDRVKLQKPEDVCIAVMKMPAVATHAGIFVQGRILHLTPNGVKYDKLSLLKLHYRLSFYK